MERTYTVVVTVDETSDIYDARDAAQYLHDLAMMAGDGILDVSAGKEADDGR